MNVTLVAMPWQSLSYPSLALGILKAKVSQKLPAWSTTEIYANFRFAELALEEFGITPNQYEAIATLVLSGIGEWIFSSALNGVETWRLNEFAETMTLVDGTTPDQIERLHRRAPRFVEEIADSVLATKPDVVAFTTTFMQNASSLALARVLKGREPALRIAFGGANCDGDQGIALARNFPYVDFVVRGEGEIAFVQLLEAVASSGSFGDIAGLCWRDADGTLVTNVDSGILPVSEIPEPDYGTYFEVAERSPVAPFITPIVVLEAARGCWWGEKHQCTFCGLNGSGIKFRSKPPSRVLEEIANAVKRYGVLDIGMVDNIIDMKYFKSVLPDLAERDWDLRIHYEVKSNLHPHHVRTLRRAGVVHIQPGIESLSSNVLKLMDKGVTGAQNVRLLREAENESLTVSWNYLYGFPGETDEDYDSIVSQIPNLFHLQPPGGATRIVVERYSPFFNRPELGFAERTPRSFYGTVYDLAHEELMDLAFAFDSPRRGIGDETERRLHSGLESWSSAYQTSSLFAIDEGPRLRIVDERAGRKRTSYTIDDALTRLLLAELAETQRSASLKRTAVEHGYREDDVDARLAWLRERGLTFEDAGLLTALATVYDATNVRIAEMERSA